MHHLAANRATDNFHGFSMVAQAADSDTPMGRCPVKQGRLPAAQAVQVQWFVMTARGVLQDIDQAFDMALQGAAIVNAKAPEHR